MGDPALSLASAKTVAQFAPALAPLAAALRIGAMRAPGLGFPPGTDLQEALRAGARVSVALDLRAVDADLAAALAGHAVDGWVVVTSDVHRSQHRNMAAAFEELAALVLHRGPGRPS